jgi:type II secretory pathway pseudopilin PulG
MSEMQLELFRGRALACVKCARQFTVDPQRTPLFRLSPGGRAYLSSPPPQDEAEPKATAAEAPAREASPPATRPPGTPASASSSAAREKRRGDDVDARWKLPAYFIAGAALAALLLAVIVLPPVTSARAAQRQLNCASNLRQISIALQVYAAGNNGNYPDTLARLVSSNLLPASTLVCPATDHTVAPGATPQLQAGNLVQGKSVSYVYIGSGMTTAAGANPQTVILYEPLENHGASKGTHVLYANGSMAFLVPPVAQQTVQALAVPGVTTAPTPAMGTSGN